MLLQLLFDLIQLEWIGKVISAFGLLPLACLLLSEQRLSPNQIAEREGVNPSTVWRWIMKGVRGVKLESAVLGGARFSSVEALERFSAACTAAAAGGQATPQARTPKQREADIDRAEQELAKLGV